MKLRVDLEKCVGHRRCYELPPQLFEEDGHGRCRIRHEIASPDLEKLARLSEANRPEEAITVEES